MPTNTPVTSAHVALREATAALRHGRTARHDHGPLSEPARQLLATDAADTLEALAGVLRDAGLEPVPTSSAGHEFHALLHQVLEGATLGRRVAGLDRDTIDATTTRIPAQAAITPDD